MRKLLKSAASVQFATWVVLFAGSFIVAVQALDALGVGTTIAFAAGIVFGELTDHAVGYFTDWYLAEQKTEVPA